MKFEEVINMINEKEKYSAKALNEVIAKINQGFDFNNGPISDINTLSIVDNSKALGLTNNSGTHAIIFNAGIKHLGHMRSFGLFDSSYKVLARRYAEFVYNKPIETGYQLYPVSAGDVALYVRNKMGSHIG